MLDLETAKSLTAYDRLYSNKFTASNGGPITVRITSVKTWKSRPQDVLVKVKYGLREFFSIDQHKLNEWSTDREEALNEIYGGKEFVPDRLS